MRLYEFADDLLVSAWPDVKNVPQLRAAGVTAIVSLAVKPPPFEVRHAVEPGCYNYRYFPDSYRALDLSQLNLAVRTVNWYRGRGHTVLVHCHLGRDRSVAVAAIAEGIVQGWSGEEALAHARAVRPGCLRNPRLLELVESGDWA